MPFTTVTAMVVEFPIRRIQTPVPVQAPSITTGPLSHTVLNGDATNLIVSATGPSLAYQWSHDDVTIPGATNSTLAFPAVTFTDAGRYTVHVSNSAGTITSEAARLTVHAISRIANLSILTPLSPAGDTFTLGYVVGGSNTGGAKPLVLRAVGPSLGALGVPGTLDDPKLELYVGSAKTGENDNWGGAASLATAMAAVGAFPYASNTSRDAAAMADITSRDNSVKVSAIGSGTGTVIAEIYDATPSANFTVTTPRLLNVSVLKQLGTGLTAGFVIGGSSAKTVLIRAIGPGLAAVGLSSGFVADPKMELFNASAAKIGENDNWGDTAALTAAFTSVGAFMLPAGSRDAAVVATLQPGNYSVEVKPGTANATGLALVEVYEVP